MSEQQLGDAVRNALNTAVASYGISVLSDPQALGDVAGRLLPGMPHARNLLMAAAGANVAATLRQQQQLQADPAAAVQQAARELAQRTGTDPASSQWITAEFARALGFPAESAATLPFSATQQSGYGAGQPGYGGPQPGYGTQQPGAQQPAFGYQPPAASPQPGAQQPGAQQPGAQQPGSGFGGPGAQPQQPGYGYQQPGLDQQPAAAQSGYGYQQPGFQQPGYQQPGYQQQQPGGWQMPTPGVPGYPQRSRSGGRTALIALGAVVVVLLAYVGIAAGTHIFPFAKSGSGSPGVTAHGGSTPSASSSPSPSGGTLPAGLADLTQLLPQVIDDPGTQCTPLNAPYHWKMTGVVSALACDQVPGLTNGTVFAYQLDSAADYQTAWQNYNTWWGFDGANAGSACPPPDASSQGTQGYYNNLYPQRTGQVLECEMVSSNEPAYTWTMPTENAFVIAQAAAGTTFATLDTWWTHNATPAAAPTPGQ